MRTAVAAIAARRKSLRILFTLRPNWVLTVAYLHLALDFGRGVDADAIIEHEAQFRFFTTVVVGYRLWGLAQADIKGNFLNVSKFAVEVVRPRVVLINILKVLRKSVFLFFF